MAKEEKKFRFLFIRAFKLPDKSNFRHLAPDSAEDIPKEQRLANYSNIKHLLEDVDWELLDGAIAPYGDWSV